MKDRDLQPGDKVIVHKHTSSVGVYILAEVLCTFYRSGERFAAYVVKGSTNYNGEPIYGCDKQSDMKIVKEDGPKMNTDESLNLLVSYNGYSDYVKNFLGHISASEKDYVTCPEWLKDPHSIAGWIWFILVCRFGDYGTSPRFGWIEDKNGAMKFLRYLLNDPESPPSGYHNPSV